MTFSMKNDIELSLPVNGQVKKHCTRFLLGGKDAVTPLRNVLSLVGFSEKPRS